MKRIVFILVSVFLVCVTPVYAQETKALFEYADSLTQEEAFTRQKEDPDNRERVYVLGLVSLKFHQDKEAEAIFDRLLADDPASKVARWAKAELLRRRHEYSGAGKMLEALLKDDPLFAPALLTSAYMKYMGFDFNGCVTACESIIAQGREKIDLGNYVRAYAIMAGAKGMIAHYGGWVAKLLNGTRVLSTLKKAESLMPDSPSVLLGLGSFYLCAPTAVGGSVKEAEKYLLRAVEADPLIPEAYVRLAQLYKLKKDARKYNELLEKALSIDPQNEIALDIKNQTCRFICP